MKFLLGLTIGVSLNAWLVWRLVRSIRNRGNPLDGAMIHAHHAYLEASLRFEEAKSNVQAAEGMLDELRRAMDRGGAKP